MCLVVHIWRNISLTNRIVHRHFKANVSHLCNKARCYSSMKVLNVAEKNDAAKNIASLLSEGNSRRRDGFSKFNKIYEFECNVFNQRCTMIMTSVSGHLLGLDFVGSYKNWRACNPLALFDAPVAKYCPKEYEQIKRTLEREVRSCGALIIWTDCDREGENIGFEVIQVCTAVKSNLRIHRAKFSEITRASVRRAIQNLGVPDEKVSAAVDVRQELDLRIGAAFTRFQTLRLQQVFPESLKESLISYGSCQFPTLGFVVERYNAIKEFIPEKFWKLKVTHTQNDLTVDFRWKRVHVFDELACQVLHDKCTEASEAKVEDVQTKPKSKWRPLPLDTIELEKVGSKKLKINAKEIMRIAEKLYTQGFISYPRTETNIFPKELNLRNLVELHVQDSRWGSFAAQILQNGPNPRVGKKSDQAHPPIHPIKHASELQGNDQRVYEYIVRHFLACCSKDAEGYETIVTIDVGGEKFAASGLMIVALNYLEVYPYEKWNAKEIHVYRTGQTFEPTSVEIVEGETSPPNLLTEADLIALMEKHGIGTDATHADHIETIKSRFYVGMEDGSHFVPGELGMGLVEGYDSMGFPMSKPNLRAELEADLKDICEGKKSPDVVLREQLARYKAVFEVAMEQAQKLDQALSQYFREAVQQPVVPETSPVFKCPSCGADMTLREKREGNGKYISCMGYPNCRNALWLPSSVEQVELSGETCPQTMTREIGALLERNGRGNWRTLHHFIHYKSQKIATEPCGPPTQTLKFKFRRGALAPYFPDNYTGCVAGCDPHFLDCLDVRLNVTRPTPSSSADRSLDSGIGSLNNTRVLQPNQNINNQRRQDPPPQQVTSNATNFTQLRRGRVPDPENAVVCSCNADAVLLTVKKDGPNKGRQFYKCSKAQGEGCNFFMWADVNENTSTDPVRNRTANVPVAQVDSGGDDITEVNCHCGNAAKRLTVQKEGPNKGRPFFVCSQPQAQRCNFFQWADGVQPQQAPQRNRGQIRRPNPDSSDMVKKKRKCGGCRQEGHTRKNCPFGNS